jgi:hypothetical protein
MLSVRGAHLLGYPDHQIPMRTSTGQAALVFNSAGRCLATAEYTSTSAVRMRDPPKDRRVPERKAARLKRGLNKKRLASRPIAPILGDDIAGPLAPTMAFHQPCGYDRFRFRRARGLVFVSRGGDVWLSRGCLVSGSSSTGPSTVTMSRPESSMVM